MYCGIEDLAQNGGQRAQYLPLGYADPLDEAGVESSVGNRGD